MRASTRFLKPYLTEQAKARRLAWALRWVRDGHGGTRTFDTMDSVVMVDEKWFFMKKQGQKYILAEGEDRTHGSAQVTHQEGDVPGSCQAPAQGHPPQPQFQWEDRHLPVHQAGAGPTEQQAQGCGYDGDADGGGEQGGVQGEDAERCLPRHQKAMWPDLPGRVFVQQDNAPAHNIGDDPDIVAAGTADGWDIRLLNQPANSPDTKHPGPGLLQLDPVPPRQDYQVRSTR